MAKKREDVKETAELNAEEALTEALEVQPEEEQAAEPSTQSDAPEIFQVVRAPSPMFGFYSVSKGPVFMPTDPNNRFVDVEDWGADSEQKYITADEWDSMLIPQDFSQLPAFQAAYQALPEAINRILWRRGYVAQPTLNARAVDHTVAEFRKLIERAILQGE